MNYYKNIQISYKRVLQVFALATAYTQSIKM